MQARKGKMMDGSVQPAKLPKTAKERGKVAPAKLAHVVLKTPGDRVKLVLDWYKTVLEAEAMFETEHFGFVTYDSEHHRIAVLGLPGVEEHVDGKAGLHHIAFTYANLGDLSHTYYRLKDAGITPEYSINHGPTTSMYFFDLSRQRRIHREPDRHKVRSGRAVRPPGRRRSGGGPAAAAGRHAAAARRVPAELTIRIEARPLAGFALSPSPLGRGVWGEGLNSIRDTPHCL
jgi:catechol 2,3-dioxygenase-like lactoylglutathione lyase family enzyme